MRGVLCLLYQILPASLGLRTPFTYESEEALDEGQIVRIPLGKRHVWGMVVEETEAAPTGKTLKAVESVSTLVLSKAMQAFLKRAARYNVSDLGAFLKMALPCPDALDTKYFPEDPPAHAPQLATLSPEQNQAYNALLNESHTPKTIVFEGITGSGKTEVYLSWLKTRIASGGCALVLLPEIALTPQWRMRFEKRFGIKPILWHSALTPKQRRCSFLAIMSAQAPVIVGTRSALFLPYPNLKAIVVDEEHDLTFKQDTTPLYHGRDMAVLRGHLERIPVILASATPSLESLHNVQREKYAHVTLNARFQSQLPTFHALKRPSKGLLAPQMIEKIGETIDAGGQSLLFLNRRGYAPFVMCKTCTHILECPHCAVGLTYHKRRDHLLCHHCGLCMEKICKNCGGETILTLSGTGVEKLEETLCEHFPKARISIMSSDLMTPKRMEQIVQDLEEHNIDILIGTQMIAKGHHFPKLTFVGVLDIEGALHHFDFRAHEHLFQLLTQVGGRAGRGADLGSVWIQTHEPEHPLIQSLIHEDHAIFSQNLLKIRCEQALPPFGFMAAVILSGREHETRSYASTLATFIEDARNKTLNAHDLPLDNAKDLIQVLGPIPAPIPFAHKRFRWRFLVRSQKIPLQSFLRAWIGPQRHPFSIRVQIDIDPYDFM